MHTRLLIQAALWLALILAPLLQAAETLSTPDGVRWRTYTGWDGSLFLEADDVSVMAVVVPAVGGRILHYGFNGDNLIYEIPAGAGKTLANTPSGLRVGGYQCDIGPEIRGIPNHNNLWMGRYQWNSRKDHTVIVTSEPDATTGIQLEKEIVLDPETGDLGITQRMKNISDKETAFCLWDRTLCQGGGFAFFPLNKKSRFPARWSIRNRIDGKYVYDGAKPASPRVRIIDGVLVAETKGEATKVGADSDGEWIAYAKGKTLFVKYSPFIPAGDYSDGGNSVELYFDERVAELEPLSPEIKLKPNESYTFPEKWTLIRLKDEVTSYEQARALVKKVPPSPFKSTRK